VERVRIGNKWIGDNEPCLIVLEPGSTFSNVNEALKLTDGVGESNADAIKFQTFLPGDADRMMEKKDITIDFKTSTGKKKELVLDVFKRRELTKKELWELANHIRERNLIFISAPQYLTELAVAANVKVGTITSSPSSIPNALKERCKA